MKLFALLWGLSAPAPQVPTITPRCDWATSLAGSGVINNIVGNFYGLVLAYLPVAVVIGVIILGATVLFAVRRKVLPAVVLGVITVILLPTVITALTGISGGGACPVI